MPVEAYKEKALLFTVHKNHVFPPDTEARDLLCAWALGQAVDHAIPEVRSQFDADDIAAAILKRGARFFVTSITAQLVRDRNGDDFTARVSVGSLFSNAMGTKLQQYAVLGTLFYVQIMRSLVRSAGDVGTMIRRPETADDIRRGVTERLISEKLAPQAFQEKLPKLPGIK